MNRDQYAVKLQWHQRAAAKPFDDIKKPEAAAVGRIDQAPSGIPVDCWGPGSVSSSSRRPCERKR